MRPRKAFPWSSKREMSAHSPNEKVESCFEEGGEEEEIDEGEDEGYKGEDDEDEGDIDERTLEGGSSGSLFLTISQFVSLRNSRSVIQVRLRTSACTTLCL